MIQTIKDDVIYYLNIYENCGKKLSLLVFFITIVCEWYIRKILKQDYSKTRLVKRAVIMSFLSFYIYLIIGITLLSRRGQYIDVVNLQLFSVFNSNFPMQNLIYENILLFVPYSILLFFLAKFFQKIKVSLFIGIISSLAIEVAQRVFRLGRFEIDDILMNICGMMIGYLFSKVISSICLTLDNAKSRTTF